MPFDYEANTQAIVNALTAYNTTTSTPDLSSGMTTRVRNIYRNDPEVLYLRGDIYPAIFVRINRKQEEFGAMGPPGSGAGRFTKEAEVTYEVIGLYRKDGASTGHSTLSVEVMRMAENIEGVFQQEFTLSGTALWCNPEETEFLGPWGKDTMWVKGVNVTLRAKYIFR